MQKEMLNTAVNASMLRSLMTYSKIVYKTTIFSIIIYSFKSIL